MCDLDVHDILDEKGLQTSFFFFWKEGEGMFSLLNGIGWMV